MLERVQKIIASAGLCSRRAADDAVSEGRVTINGKKAVLGDKADSDKDVVKFDGRVVKSSGRFVYVALNKPRYVETTLADMGKKRTIRDYLPKSPRLYPAGRLDNDAEGLILCSNDGEFANRIMHPSFEVKKTYLATLDNSLKFSEEMELSKGVKLSDGWVRDISVKVTDKERRKIEISVHEGRNKIVKRIFKAVGHYVRRLVRIQVGPIKLGDIKPGAYMELSKKQVAFFKELRPRKRAGS